MGRGLTAGVDEAGRGPIAGPVLAAAVILPSRARFTSPVRDSKLLTPAQRERAFEEIVERAIALEWVAVEPARIDSLNILQATMAAMRQAMLGLDPRPDLVLIDGPIVPRSGLVERAVIGGDGRMRPIAAASIVAKVVRDRMMVELDREYPQYGFARHKGYATREHLAALREHGPCRAHRMTFAPIAQMTLFL
jgi:ribonuclease HII